MTTRTFGFKSFSINEKSATNSVDTRDAELLMVNTVLISGTWATAIVEIMWRMTPDDSWRSFVPPQRLIPGMPYTPIPISVAGVPETSARVTTVEGAEGEIELYFAVT